MPKLIEIDGYEKFCEYVDKYKSDNGTLYLLFTGSKEPSGESWCSDCKEAHPVIEKVIKSIPDNITFATVYVGDRPTWKDGKCPFRTDSRLMLLVIPTIMKWKGFQKLSGDQVGKEDLLELLFTEEDDD